MRQISPDSGPGSLCGTAAGRARVRSLRPIRGDTLPEAIEREFNALARYQFRLLLQREKGHEFPDPRDQDLVDRGTVLAWRLRCRRADLQRGLL